MRCLSHVLLLLLAAAGAAFVARVSAEPPREPPRAALGAARQLVLVTTDSWDAVRGTLRRFARSDVHGTWSAVGDAVLVVVGKKGLAWSRDGVAERAAGPVKREGDARAPAGILPLVEAFGQSPRPLAHARLPYRFLADDVECVDDAASGHYNQLVARRSVNRVDWTSSEKMWMEPLYKWGVVVEYNKRPVTPGDGSCIFLHIWRGPGQGTAGCTAMDETALTSLIAWLSPARGPVLVQLPRPEYERLRAEWKLP